MPVKSFFFVLLALTVSMGASGQSSDKYLKRLAQDAGVLYFIKPQQLKSGKVIFEPDFSYLYTPDTDSPVRLNFSLITRKPVRNVKELQLLTDGKVIATLQPEARYVDRKGNKWTARFAGELPAEALLRLLAAGDQASFRLRTAGREIDFPADRPWEKAAEVLSETLRVEWTATKTKEYGEGRK